MNRLLIFLSGCCSLVAAAQSQPTERARHALEAPLKVFWASPSVERFVDVGKMIRGRMNWEDVRREEESGEPYRPPVKEFEAVKKRMAEGVVVSGPVSSRPRWAPDDLPRPLAQSVKRAQLPDARRSFFGDDEPFVIPLRPFRLAHQSVEMADALSAHHRVEIRMRVLGPPKMGTHGIYGVWDVGRVGIRFSRPARVHALAASGARTGADILSMQADFTINCGERGLRVDMKSLTAEWGNAIVAWIGKAPVGTATITTRQIRGKDQYEKLMIDTVDVDRDGVPDFSIWSGLDEAVASTDTFWKAVFVNLAGKWTLLAFAQEADCT